MQSRLGEVVGDVDAEGQGAGGTRLAPNAHADPMAGFMKEVGLIDTTISHIRTNVHHIREAHALALSSISPKEQTESTKAAEVLMRDTSQQIAHTKGRLQTMKRHVAEMGKTDRTPPAHLRMATSMHWTLSRKLLDVLTDFNAEQTSFHQRYREKIARQVKLVKPGVTDQEIDQLLEHGDGALQDTMADTKRAQVNNAYLDIREKHRDLVVVAQRLEEVHALFKDVHDLLQAQSQMIESIEENVSHTLAFTSKGEVALVTANKQQRSAQKKMLALLFLLLVVLGLLFSFFL